MTEAEKNIGECQNASLLIDFRITFFESSNFVSFSLPTFRFVLIGIVGSISRFCNVRVFSFILFYFPFPFLFFFFCDIFTHRLFFIVLYSHFSNSLLIYPFVCTQNLPSSKRITSLNKINRKSPLLTKPDVNWKTT